jgi:hypothetical protein
MHLSEEQLVSYRYGEAKDAAAMGEHLAACATCRAAYQSLERVLAAVDQMPAPDPGENYAAAVWERLQPRLQQCRPARRDEGAVRSLIPLGGTALFPWRRLALAAAMAVLIVAAFLLGHFWPRPQTVARQPLPEQVRERILLVALGEHLERSQMILIELANANPGPQLDVSGERRWAADLVGDNRLYRQAAARAGDPAMTAVLDDLERVLLEISHSPSTLSGGELERIQRRIESGDILFKLRVVESKVRRQEEKPNGL